MSWRAAGVLWFVYCCSCQYLWERRKDWDASWSPASIKSARLHQVMLSRHTVNLPSHSSGTSQKNQQIKVPFLLIRLFFTHFLSLCVSPLLIVQNSWWYHLATSNTTRSYFSYWGADSNTGRISCDIIVSEWWSSLGLRITKSLNLLQQLTNFPNTSSIIYKVHRLGKEVLQYTWAQQFT